MVMQRATHPTPITILRDHIEAWRRENRWSRETVADQIVKAHEAMGGPDLTGIKFEPLTTDTFERMRVNADRIFRWLDDTTKDRNLLPFNFVWAILLAMPVDRRVLCANDLLRPAELTAGEQDVAVDMPTAREIAESFRAVVDHGAQATVAVSQLLDGVHAGEAEQAEAKLGLAAATLQRTRGLMSRLLNRRTTCA